MCPACLTSMALVIAGATSTGGVTALVVRKLRAKRDTKESPGNLKHGTTSGTENDQ